MGWIKRIAWYLLVVSVTIVVLDVVAYVGFRDRISEIIPLYGRQRGLGRGYPRFHFVRDDELGFDIRRNFRTSTWVKPVEYKEYDVWGNSYGCFDDEWDVDDLVGGIYLAGDSFTWGYASYEKKFGTIIQDKLGIPVYSCGVTHTGQMHQFIKFKRLYDGGVRPSVVIVSIVPNDVANDYFFPHTSIIDGYMVENIEQRQVYSGGISFTRIGDDQLEKELFSARQQQMGLGCFLGQYSLTTNVLAGLTRVLQSSFPSKDTVRDKKDSFRSVYAEPFWCLSEGYEKDSLSVNNRAVLDGWIAHSKKNGYILIFSLIPAKPQYERMNGYYPSLMRFIKNAGGVVVSFSEYLDERNIMRDSLYYNANDHFNELGNKYYAEYLIELVQSIKQ